MEAIPADSDLREISELVALVAGAVERDPLIMPLHWRVWVQKATLPSVGREVALSVFDPESKRYIVWHTHTQHESFEHRLFAAKEIVRRVRGQLSACSPVPLPEEAQRGGRLA